MLLVGYSRCGGWLLPLFAFHGSYALSDEAFIGFEIEGNYADTSYINGDGDDATTGAIADMALSLNTRLHSKLSTRAEIRYLTGGARGSSPERDNDSGDGFSSNWIDAALVSLGLVFHLDEWN